MKKSLYNISEEMLELQQDLANCEGELTQELEERMAITSAELESKAIAYAAIITEMEQDVIVISDECIRMALRKKKYQRDIDRLKDTLSSAMLEFGMPKIKNPLFSLSHRKSEVTEIYDQSLIPSDYLEDKVTITVDKRQLKEDLKNGKVVEGARLLTKQNIQIR